MTFPTSPSNDDLHTEFGRTFKYSSASNSWSVATPDAPEDNALTTQGYVDTQSLPLTGVAAGSKAFVQDGNKLFIFTGSGWFEIATINTAPTITSGADATYTLNSDGTPTVITLQATDPEGTPIVWGYQVTSGSLEDTTVTNVGGVFTITPGTTDATFDLAFTASDGVNIDTSASSFTLSFINPDAWDITKLQFANTDLNGSTLVLNNTNAHGFVFKDDGTKFYYVNRGTDTAFTYDLSTPWDISTATLNSETYVFTTQDTVPTGITIGNSGTKLYMAGSTNNKIFEYNLSVAWDISSAIYVQSFATGDRPYDCTFNTDGTILFVTDNASDSVYRYNLSTPWDISTATYNSQSLSVFSQEASPYSVSFKDDGTKMYVTGTSGSDINQYNLSTPWDITTAIFVTSVGFGYDCLDTYWGPKGETLFALSGGGITKYIIPFV